MARGRLLLGGSLTVAALAISGPNAAAETNGGGRSATAPGQANAHENCVRSYQRQARRGINPGGGPKQSESAPLNCDHYWPAPGRP